VLAVEVRPCVFLFWKRLPHPLSLFASLELACSSAAYDNGAIGDISEGSCDGDQACGYAASEGAVGNIASSCRGQEACYYLGFENEQFQSSLESCCNSEKECLCAGFVYEIDYFYYYKYYAREEDYCESLFEEPPPLPETCDECDTGKNFQAFYGGEDYDLPCQWILEQTQFPVRTVCEYPDGNAGEVCTCICA